MLNETGNMRKIIMYASLSWDASQWEKQLTWGDPDLTYKPINTRGSKIDQDGRKYDNVIEDLHIMYALYAKNTKGGEMTITPIEKESDVYHLKMNGGST